MILLFVICLEVYSFPVLEKLFTFSFFSKPQGVQNYSTKSQFLDRLDGGEVQNKTGYFTKHHYIKYQFSVRQSNHKLTLLSIIYLGFLHFPLISKN